MKFEEIAIDFYADGEPNELVLTSAKSTDAIGKLDETVNSFKNPFAECDIWL